ncbi:DUF4340 domain-containing protein [Spirochaeta dissipatitropha]
MNRYIDYFGVRNISYAFCVLLLVLIVIFGNRSVDSDNTKLSALIDDGLLLNAEEIHLTHYNQPSLILSMNNGDWLISIEDDSIRLPARNDRVEAFLDVLQELRKRRKVSLSSSDSDRLGFGQPIRLDVYSREDSVLLSGLFGFVSSNSREKYFRFEDSEEILAIDTTISFYLHQGLDYWQDQRILQAE